MALLRLTFLLLCMAVPTACTEHKPMQSYETVRLCDKDWKLELAMDDESIRRGLMHRQSIPEGEGMLFIFPDSDIRSFWMANCLINIDLIFIDGRGYITSVHRMKAEDPQETDETEIAYNARMKHYWSGLPARFAIELPEGSIDACSLKANQKVNLDVDGLKALRTRADTAPGP